MGEFRRRYFRHVRRDALGLTDLVGSLSASVLGVAAHFVPWAKSMLEALAWQIPLWALGGVLVSRLVVAPYRIWKEDQAEIARLKATLEAYAARPLPELAFDPSDPRCMSHERPFTRAGVIDVTEYRLRVRNPSTTVSMDDLTVVVDPSKFAAELRLAMWASEDFPAFLGPITLHPQAAEYVLLGRFQDRQSLPDGNPQVVTVRARARNLPEVVATFVIDPAKTPAVYLRSAHSLSEIG
jgi:hypothetical protein